MSKPTPEIEPVEPRVIQPPEIIPIDGQKILFLNGPIQGAPDWQTDVIHNLQSLGGDCIIANPRKDYAPGEFVYERQVDWETHYRRRSAEHGVHLFCLANQEVETRGRAYGQTTRAELFESLVLAWNFGVPVVIAMEGAFGNNRYITRRFQQDAPSVLITDNLSDLCKAAVEAAAKSTRRSIPWPSSI